MSARTPSSRASATPAAPSTSLSPPPRRDNGDLLKLQLKETTLEFSWPITRITSVFPESATQPSSMPTHALWRMPRQLPHSLKSLTLQRLNSNSPLEFLPFSGDTLPFKASRMALLWEKDLDLVNKLAFKGEKIIRGNPSGIDNTLPPLFGNVIIFKSGNLTHLKSSVSIKILITNTKVGRNTKAFVAGVGERMLRHLDIMAFVFSAIDSINNELISILKSPTPNDLLVIEKEEKIEELMDIDLNATLSCVNDCLPNNEKGKKAGVIPNRIIDLEIGVEDNLNHQVTSVPSPKYYLDLTPEVHTIKKSWFN
ncbi:Mevalonate kinase [Glycine max]|nr:hypothetical protein JHK85_006692 [Glycine max]KAG5071294.1 hypothetical protein JHK86_006505 [Glycine max]KAH1068802.1 hypothetical protein GYH30_006391 [Glycine max]KAH1256732.1 Mevalonate kinase [Glycine max]